MVIWKAFRVTVREISAEVKQLQGGEYSGHSPHDNRIEIWRAERDIEQGEADQYADLAQAEIGREELIIPRPKSVWVIGVKIGIARRAAFGMMLVVGRRHNFPAKPCVDKHNGCADNGVPFGLSGDKRAVDSVMGDNKYADIKPALQHNKPYRLPQRSGELVYKQAVKVNG